MYEGYLQHDAQEVLQCILGYVQEACDTIRKEQELEREDDVVIGGKMKNDHSDPSISETGSKALSEEDSQVNGKRKSDTEVGNAKKKPKSVKSKKSDAEDDGMSRNKPLTRSKRKSSSDLVIDSTLDKDEEVAAEKERMKKPNEEEESGSENEGKGEKSSKEAERKRKKRVKLGWLRPSGKQPSIFSKFRSVGKISSMIAKNQNQPEQEKREEKQSQNEKTAEDHSSQDVAKEKRAVKHQGMKL